MTAAITGPRGDGRVTRNRVLGSGAALALALLSTAAAAQDLQERPVPPPPPSGNAAALPDDQVDFSADNLEYNFEGDIVTAGGDVRMFREGNRLRADRIVWNRKTGQVTATGNIAIVNPQGDTAYGDSIDLTDSLKDGVVENMLVVLDEGGRLAANRGVRKDGYVTLESAAYTACAVTTTDGCPKEPTWKITAVRIVYDPFKKRVSYKGAKFNLFGLTVPIPNFSNSVGGDGDYGILSPDVRYDRSNGLSVAVPYYFNLAPNRALTLTPRVFSNTLPLLQGEYQALTGSGAYRVGAYATYSRRNDDFVSNVGPVSSERDFRGYLDANGRFQLDPQWSVSGSLRVATDRTFLRRYQISYDDRLRNTVGLERIDADSYLSIRGWATQSLRLNGQRDPQPVALPEFDYRRRFGGGLDGAKLTLQVNTLALTRGEGQDTQRAFASAQWDLRRLTPWGQEVTLTALARGDVYHSDDTLLTTVVGYRGEEGVQTRALGALAVDVRWPLVGDFGRGTQRVTPRVQLVAAPRTRNFAIPNEDSRAIDLDTSNLFALNRFPGYDRFEDASRLTYGIEWSLAFPGVAIDTTVGQSYRLDPRAGLFPDGTGLTGRLSDIVGRTEVRYRDFVSLAARYRLDKQTLAVRRNEIDARIGSRQTYALLGYLRLNRDIGPTLEDLGDREEARAAGRVAISRFWSAFGSITLDLTDRNEDTLSLADGFDPVRHRLGVAYEDDCLRLGVTWRRDYERQGDARSGNSYLLSLSFKNLGR
ncbi:MAG: LPS assembly protein LptD [Pseudomonadota bacterium]